MACDREIGIDSRIIEAVPGSENCALWTGVGSYVEVTATGELAVAAVLEEVIWC